MTCCEAGQWYPARGRAPRGSIIVVTQLHERKASMGLYVSLVHNELQRP
jgi:hypothetical protein